ncbi:MAG: HlyD family efflux transporter periplasmic adaptor subunit [Planctomycetota bacterium]
MTNQNQTVTPTAEAPTTPAANPLTSLAQLTVLAESPDAYLADAVGLVSEHLGAPLVIASARCNARDIDAERVDEASAAWLPHLRDLALEVSAAPRPFGRRIDVHGTGVALIAAPITGKSVGTIAAVFVCEDRASVEGRLRELHAIAATVTGGLERLTGSSSTPAASPDRAADAIQRAGSYTSIEQFAYALTNNLRNKLGAESVAFALPVAGRAQIISVSGLDEVRTRGPGTNAMQQAIEEAMDQRRPLCAQADTTWQDDRISTGHPLHNAWSAAAKNAAVASIPIFADDELTGIVAIRRRVEEPFTRAEFEAAVELLVPFGVAVPMVRRATRSLLGHTRDTVREAALEAIRPRAWGWKALAIATTAFAGWFSFGTMPYAVSARAAVRPSERYVLAAPFDGSVTAADFRAGDVVAKGQLLATLDTRDLELERAELLAKSATLRVELDSRAAAGELSDAALAAAELGANQARVSTLDRRIEDARIVAPDDGVIIAGEPRELLGQRLQMGDPIFTFVPSSRLSVEIYAPEHAADDLSAGQNASFAPDASPGFSLPLTVERIRPSAEPRDGRNTVAATAVPTGSERPDWLVAGMEGSAKVNAGKRRVWWVVFHRLIEGAQARFGL